MSNPFSLIAETTLVQGRYRVNRLIAKGGMGAVYEARDERLGHTIALKQNFYGTDDQLKRAFEREARLLAHLKHSALPRVTDYFTEEFGQFLVMDFIAGEDLRAMLKQRGRAFGVEEVLRWADQLLDALDYLHSQTPPIIHRDVKPQNLKVTTEDAVKLLDFGLAKGTTSGLTSVMAGSSVVGFTPGYAPLEQVTGKGTDARSDVYSLGATLYQLLTNQAPPDAMARLGETTNDEPDPLVPAAQLNALVPPKLSSLLSKAMSLKRSERPTSAKAMREALKACVADDEQTRIRVPDTPPVTPSPSARTSKAPPIIVDFSPKVSLRQPAVLPQTEMRKPPAKAWVLLITALYFLAIVSLTCPVLIFAFWPKPGGVPDHVVKTWPYFGDIYLQWHYWVFLAVLILSQIILLKVPVAVAGRNKVTRRSLLWPIIVTAIMAGGLIIGVLVSLIETFTQASLVLMENPGIFLAIGGMTWALWTIVFYLVSRDQDARTVISRQFRLLLAGSILELLIAVPTHIVARTRDYCCAGFMTFVGIALGIAIMLMSFGPGVFFLFLDRWNRLHKFRQPVNESSHD